MKSFINEVYFSNILTDKQKVDLITKIAYAFRGKTIVFTNNYFLALRKDIYSQDDIVKLWHKVTMSDGSVVIEDSKYSYDKIIELYANIFGEEIERKH